MAPRIIFSVSSLILCMSVGNVAFSADEWSISPGVHRSPVSLGDQLVVLLCKSPAKEQTSQIATLLRLRNGVATSEAIQSHPNTTAVARGNWKRSPGYITAEPPNIHYRDLDGKAIATWTLDSNWFVSWLVSVAEERVVLFKAFDKKRNTYLIGRLHEDEPRLQTLVSGDRVLLLQNDQIRSSALGIRFFEADAEAEIVELLDPSLPSTTIRIPDDFFPVSGPNDRGQIVGRYLKRAPSEARVALWDLRNRQLEFVSSDAWRTSEPAFNSSGDIAFSRDVPDSLQQHLCISTGGKVTILHRSLTGGGSRFCWDNGGRALWSVTGSPSDPKLRYDLVNQEER